MTACLLEGCGDSRGMNTQVTATPDTAIVSEDTVPTETTDTSKIPDTTGESADTPVTEPAKDKEATAFSFADISNVEFCFESGAGAWCTLLFVNSDGTFQGEYHDSDMGDIGDGYPNGTYYVCNFSGKFTEPEKVDDYTYSVTIESIELEQKPGTEEIEDEMRYVYSEPYGLDDATELLFYLPGIAVVDLPEGYKSWMTSYGDIIGSTLPFYGLYNVNTEEGFSSYEMELSVSIDEELAGVEQEAADLENKLNKEDLTQTEMNTLSSDLYQLWDTELNAIWNQLKEKLDSSAMDSLTNEERKWITKKENEIKRAGADYEGGTMQPMVECLKGAELTKDRVYELADYLR